MLLVRDVLGKSAVAGVPLIAIMAPAAASVPAAVARPHR